MGTRSLTVVSASGKSVPCVVMYRQFYGYPEGHGRELAEFLAPLRITNGISGDSKNTANGAECLAAQIVAHFKKDVGGIYLVPFNPDGQDNDQEYEYYVVADVEDGSITIKVVAGWRGKKTIFEGDAAAFLETIAKGHTDA